MAERHDTIIGIGTKADLAGAVQTEKQFERLKQKARELGKANADAAKTSQSAFARLGGAIGKLNAALNGFGAVAAIASLVSAVKRVSESFKDATEEAEKFDKAKKIAAQEKKISDLADAYKELTKSIQDSVAANEHENRMLDRKVAVERELEDARMNAAKQRELDAIATDDPEEKEKRAAVETKYARLSGNLSATRKKQDIVYARQRLESEAVQADRTAKAKTDSAATDDDMIAELTKRRNKALAGSVQDNSQDITDNLGRFWGDVWKTVSFRWGKIGDYRTEEGDAVRKSSLDESERLQKQIEKLQSDRDAKLREAEDAATLAKRKREEADIEAGRLTAASINVETSDAAGTYSFETADRAVEASRAKRAAEANELSTARSGVVSTQSQIDAAKRQLAQIQERRSANGLEEYQARNAFEFTQVNNRPRREQSEAYQNLDQVRTRVQNANHSLDKAESAILSTLETLTERLKNFERIVQQGEKRAKANASDAQGGY